MSSEEFLVEFDETDRILQDESSKKQIYIEMASQPDIYTRLTVQLRQVFGNLMMSRRVFVTTFRRCQ